MPHFVFISFDGISRLHLQSLFLCFIPVKSTLFCKETSHPHTHTHTKGTKIPSHIQKFCYLKQFFTLKKYSAADGDQKPENI